MSKRVEPSIKSTAFSCPHCGAHTTQHWHSVFVDSVKTEDKLPSLPNESIIEHIKNNQLDEDRKARIIKDITRMMNGEIFFERRSGSNGVYLDFEIPNMHISQCYNCDGLAIWLYDRLLFPVQRAGIEPNDDLDEDIRHDFEEARAILDLSPRGAAALLRLAVQKLCKQLGESGKNIDKDIASLVSKGLNTTIQKALDIVRVIGNEAVHPGTMDLSDDRDTALKLFGLINAIVDQMISHPKQVESLYETLPADKRAGIDVRNAAALAKGQPPH